MKLEDQVVSLKLAKKLKELGVKQDSLVEWRRFHSVTSHYSEWFLGYSDDPLIPDEICAAFTVAELGEILPYEMCDQHEDLPYFLTTEKRENPTYWMVYFREEDRGVLADRVEEATTEADARAKMLIYLIENNLLTP